MGGCWPGSLSVANQAAGQLDEEVKKSAYDVVLTLPFKDLYERLVKVVAGPLIAQHISKQ